MSTNQVDYTSRDYAAIKADLVNAVKNNIPEWDGTDESDFTLALLEAFAYMGDIMSYYIDRAANEAHVQTATQRDSLLKFAEVMGYKPSGPTPAAGVMTFQNMNAPGGADINLPIGTQVAVETISGTVYFETIEPVTGLAARDTVNVPVIEGRTSNTEYGSDCLGLPVGLGLSTGTAFMTFNLPDKNVIDSSIEVYTGTGSSLQKWVYTNVLGEYGVYDKVYTTRMNSDGSVAIMFGDAVTGMVPTVGDEISATYKTSAGFSGNVKSGSTSTVVYIPGTTSMSVPVTATIPQNMVGGTNGENIAMIRQNLKRAIGTRNRAVTLKDYANLAAQVAGVGRASAEADVYSQVTVNIQPYNDGTTTPGVTADTGNPTIVWNDLADQVKSFLTKRAPVNTTITVLPPSYVKIDVVLEIEVLDGYKQSDIKVAVTRQLIDPAYGLFSYNGYGFGAVVTTGDVIAAIRLVKGVRSVELNVLDRMTDPALDIHGTGVGNITLAGGEIPSLPADNITVFITGGIV